jgi:hypothetical protein
VPVDLGSAAGTAGAGREFQRRAPKLSQAFRRVVGGLWHCVPLFSTIPARTSPEGAARPNPPHGEPVTDGASPDIFRRSARGHARAENFVAGRRERAARATSTDPRDTHGARVHNGWRFRQCVTCDPSVIGSYTRQGAEPRGRRSSDSSASRADDDGAARSSRPQDEVAEDRACWRRWRPAAYSVGGLDEATGLFVPARAATIMPNASALPRCWYTGVTGRRARDRRARAIRSAL